jgi:PAS domain S-box-containing protein
VSAAPRSEEFGLLIDAVLDYAIFLLSPEGKIRTWNSGARRTFGYEEDDVIEHHVSIFYTPEDLAEDLPGRELEVAARDGRIENQGWRLRKDGKRFWANTIITVLRNDDGSVRGFANVARDMTVQRDALERTRQNAEVFQLLVSSVRDYAIFMLDPTGHVATWNTGAQTLKGYKPDEIIGRHFSTFYTQEDLDDRKPERELVIAREKGSVEDEGWRLRKDGTRFWANVVITAVYDSRGLLRGFAKVTRDITRQKEADEQLRQSNEIFQLLVSSVRDYAIFMLDPDGRIATWNSGAQRIKGYLPDEIIGRHFSAFYTQEDLDDKKPERELVIAREQGSVEDEGWRVRKDGTRFWANVIITAVRDSHGELRGFAKVTRDITERKRNEETQRALLEQREARLIAEQERSRAEASYRVAQEANRAKDEFLMTLSHELRTPMTAILGWSRLLPTMLPNTSGEDVLFRDAISSIATNAALQARLIDDILDVSRIVSGKLRLTPEGIEVSRLVMNAIDSVGPTAEAKNISITTALAPALGSIIVDGTRIQQVIWNLLTNALKFTPKHGSVTLAAQRTTSQLQISVTDTGEGIDPQFLAHVFEPFRQAESPSTRTHGGLGLGLSIVRYIAEAHGGSISAQSEGRGKGATFTLTLPIRAVAVTAEELAESSPAIVLAERKELRGMDIVLVDDDLESRKVVGAILTAAGANLRAFDSAHAALAAIDDRQPRLVITDIAMPELDGYALTHMLRTRDYGKDMKILALSAFPAGLGQQNEFNAYLSKPVDPFHLINEISRIAATETSA